MITARYLADSLVNLFFPHQCIGCGTDGIENSEVICTACYALLSPTGFVHFEDNPIERIFTGRVRIVEAASQYYFARQALLQKLMHALKYAGRKDVGMFLGKEMGRAISGALRFSSVDALVPVPLHKRRLKERGYNQAAVLCEGMAGVMGLPILNNAVQRLSFTGTQTKQDRVHRWTNMDGRFAVADPSPLINKHILLIDDIVTTGATLEACANALLQVEGLQLSIMTVAYAVPL